MPNYYNDTRNPNYSILASLPLLIAYEIILAFNSNGRWQIRNAADSWIRYFLRALEVNYHQVSFVMIGSLIIAFFAINHKYNKIEPKFFILMFIEAFVYALFLGFLVNVLISVFPLSNITTGITATITNYPLLATSVSQTIALSIGAGLFEEFIFRVILLNCLYLVYKPLFKTPLMASVIAIITAAFLFSLSHYVGSLADPFSLYTFTFRWVAGLVFTVLYFVRGFAITAWTHALYDIMVLL